MSQLLIAVFDVENKFAPGEYDVLRATIGDTRFIRFCRLQQEAAKEALAQIEPRMYIGKEQEYFRIAADAQLLHQFWKGVGDYAEDYGLKAPTQEQRAPQQERSN